MLSWNPLFIVTYSRGGGLLINAAVYVLDILEHFAYSYLIRRAPCCYDRGIFLRGQQGAPLNLHRGPLQELGTYVQLPTGKSTVSSHRLGLTHPRKKPKLIL